MQGRVGWVWHVVGGWGEIAGIQDVRGWLNRVLPTLRVCLVSRYKH